MIKKSSLVVSFLMVLFLGFGQTTSKKITFQPRISNESIELNKVYALNDSVQLEITTCRFYVSNFSFLSKGKLVSQQKSAFLLDLEHPTSLDLSFPSTEFDGIQFNLGIDSSTNVAGILDGDLDPINGMYWTWNSGYINFKLEGTYAVKNVAKIPFEYHLGGYLSPYPTLQTISVETEKSESIVIQLDVQKFISAIDFNSCSNVMIPGAKAVELSKLLSNCFKI